MSQVVVQREQVVVQREATQVTLVRRPQCIPGWTVRDHISARFHTRGILVQGRTDRALSVALLKSARRGRAPPRLSGSAGREALKRFAERDARRVALRELSDKRRLVLAKFLELADLSRLSTGALQRLERTLVELLLFRPRKSPNGRELSVPRRERRHDQRSDAGDEQERRQHRA